MTSGLRIRLADAGDDASLFDLRSALDRESRFMMLEPGERERHDGLPSRSFEVVAEEGGRLIGYVGVSVLPYARARHCGHLVVGVRASHTGRGVGRALLDATVRQARQRGLRRLELTVMTHNRAALALYTRCGFQVEGLRRGSLQVDGEQVDEYYMGLLL
ncbi:N-acetyltransferase [Actinomadura sp. NBRC 104412]|uniref:GNAT family N-acetyltransferase n=1 Tax=Actinomadura sp. NBRC 104412 TaxID=3032203 RepID=UPI0024A1489E|nr:GNAT family N-acetyltransferase [Actinomadura sp. NBRC 104412]GLZ09523.1 N-acetyltransferase [Actinomadura sp. NBRC 104412]